MKREVRTVVVAEDAVVDSDEKELCSRSVSSYRIMRLEPTIEVRRIFCGESQLISMDATTPLGN